MKIPRLTITAIPRDGGPVAEAFDLAESVRLDNALARILLHPTNAKVSELVALAPLVARATGRPVTGSDPECQGVTTSPYALIDGVDTVVMVPVLLDLDQVAGLLGCSPRSVRRLVEAGELASVKVPGNTRVAAAEVNRFIERGGCA